MDVRSTRAHACQILSTAAYLSPELSLSVVLPKYHIGGVDFETVKNNHGLSQMPNVVFLRNFGIRKSGIVAFAIFNIPAIFFLLWKKINQDVDYIYFRTSYFLPVAFVAFILNIPFFYETHRRPISWSERKRDHVMSRMATGIVVISEYMREHYVSYKKKILVAHDAVSLKRFAAVVDRGKSRNKLGVMLDDKVCVYSGTISKLKGIDTLISTARLLPNLRFFLAGIVSPEFANATLPSNVKILGKLEQKELPSILQAADVLLLPHPKGEYSQSPMKLFEYMASGVPIVASRLPSICEILNEKNAILVEPGNEKSLAQGIERAINNDNLSQTISKKAYDDVQNHTWEKRGFAITEFIKNTLKSQRNNETI